MQIVNKIELNFECPICGAGVYNATEQITKCPVCGHTKLLVVKPITYVLNKGEEHGS